MKFLERLIKNQIILKDSQLGLMDKKDKVYNFISMRTEFKNLHKPSITDPLNKHKDDILWQNNFVSDNRGTMYVRRRYNLVDLFRQLGGMVAALKVTAFITVQILSYKKREIKILKNSKVYIKELKHKPWSLPLEI